MVFVQKLNVETCIIAHNIQIQRIGLQPSPANDSLVKSSHIYTRTLDELLTEAHVTESTETCANKTNQKQPHKLTCVDATSKYIAICTNWKYLIILDDQLQRIFIRSIARAAVSVVIDQTSDRFIVADKTGDVWSYSLESEQNDRTNDDETESGSLLLGHLSMILHVRFSPTNRYIATCDRDEKIRVSNYPNAYNIESFCLGHTEFVKDIAFISDEVLVSGSGDGFLIAWNVQTGDILAKLNTNQLDDATSTNLTLLKNQLGKDVDTTSVPITRLRSYKSTVAFTLWNVEKIFVYEYNVADKIFTSITTIDARARGFCLSDGELIVVDDFLTVFRLCGVSEKVYEVQLHGIAVDEDEVLAGLSVLYKKKFDNVQEYQARKKLRLNKD